VRYETVEKTAEGLRARLIEREGPTGLIVTTTRVALHPENETRLFSIQVTDTAEQTKAVLLAQADDSEQEVNLAPWHALQTWLGGGERRVAIPYAKDLAAAVPPRAVRLRRDFGAVLNLIRAHALLHQATRDRDGSGRVIATLEDYTVVRELVADLLAEGIEAAVAETIRETVEAVEKLCAPHADGDGVSVTAVANELRLDKSAASRRVRRAITQSYLRNLEEKKGRPSRLVLGEPLPDKEEVLPTSEALENRCSVEPRTEGIHSPQSSEQERPRSGPEGVRIASEGLPAGASQTDDLSSPAQRQLPGLEPEYGA
jgi:hypothetical protein